MELFQGINVVSISVPDLKAARDFYAENLGFGEPLHDLPEAGWIEWESPVPGGGNISLTRAEQGWTPSKGTTIVLNVEDCHATVAELRSRGVRADEPNVFPGFVTWANFYDPWGNRLQICSPPTEASTCEIPADAG